MNKICLKKRRISSIIWSWIFFSPIWKCNYCHNCNFWRLSGRAQKHPSNEFTLLDVLIFYMGAGRSYIPVYSGSLDEIINRHFFFTVKRVVFSINNQSTSSHINVSLSEALLPWVPPFSFHVDTIVGSFWALLESPEKLRLSIANDRTLHKFGFSRKDF